MKILAKSLRTVRTPHDEPSFYHSVLNIVVSWSVPDSFECSDFDRITELYLNCKISNYISVEIDFFVILHSNAD